MVELVNKLHTPMTQLTSTLWVRLAIYCLSWERTACKQDDLWLKSIFPPNALPTLAREVASSGCPSHSMRDSSTAPAKGSGWRRQSANLIHPPFLYVPPCTRHLQRKGEDSFVEQLSASFCAHAGISRHVSGWELRNAETSRFLLIKSRRGYILDFVLIALVVRWKPSCLQTHFPQYEQCKKN